LLLLLNRGAGLGCSYVRVGAGFVGVCCCVRGGCNGFPGNPSSYSGDARGDGGVTMEATGRGVALLVGARLGVGATWMGIERVGAGAGFGAEGRCWRHNGSHGSWRRTGRRGCFGGGGKGESFIGRALALVALGFQDYQRIVILTDIDSKDFVATISVTALDYDRRIVEQISSRLIVDLDLKGRKLKGAARVAVLGTGPQVDANQTRGFPTVALALVTDKLQGVRTSSTEPYTVAVAARVDGHTLQTTRVRATPSSRKYIHDNLFGNTADGASGIYGKDFVFTNNVIKEYNLWRQTVTYDYLDKGRLVLFKVLARNKAVGILVGAGSARVQEIIGCGTWDIQIHGGNKE
jgi:hypothetical protein